MEIDGSAIRHSLGIEAQCPHFYPRQKYQLARVDLTKAGCPLAIFDDERWLRLLEEPNIPIVVEKNRLRLGYVKAMKYYPPGIVVAGVVRRIALVNQGNTRGWMWVEKGAIPVQSNEILTVQELLTKVCEQLQKYVTREHSPAILAIYPFTSNVIFQFKQTKYRQRFVLDDDTRGLQLMGRAQIINDYLPCGDVIGQVYRRWSRPSKAVAMCRNDIKHGMYQSTVKFAGIPAVAVHVAGLLETYKISFQDFIFWSIREQADSLYRTINGRRISRSKFYAPNLDDKTTWTPRLAVPQASIDLPNLGDADRGLNTAEGNGRPVCRSIAGFEPCSYVAPAVFKRPEESSAGRSNNGFSYGRL